MRAFAGVLIVACGIAVGVVAQEPQEQAPPPPKNLQVLPKDIPRQQLLRTMQSIRTALGVQCTHCHVSSTDRASDTKPEKLIARKMLHMTMHINDEHLKGVGEPPAEGQPKVTCFTCHRGQLKPVTAPPSGGGGAQ
jgi:hypothetical protein